MTGARRRSAVILCLTAVVIASAYLGGTAPKRRFNRFLQAAAAVQIGRTTWREWETICRRYRLSAVVNDCRSNLCVVTYADSNSVLRLSRLAPPSAVVAELTFRDGVAAEMYVWFEIDARTATGQEPESGATLHEVASPTSCNKGYSAYMKRHGAGQWAVVTMDSCVLPQYRMKALAINSSCLSQPGGCGSGEQLLPEVFGETGR